MQIHAIILAGGDGNRFGGELPKQFVRLAGDPILLRTLRRLHGARIERLVVVAHPRWLDETRRLIDEAGLAMDVTVVPGGVTRNESTRNGLAALGGADEDIVLVHDAVRPLLPLEVIQRADRADHLGPRGRHRHGDPERGHAGDRGRRGRGRDPGPGPLSPGPDAPDVPGRRAGEGLRGGRGGGRPGRDRRLQPGPALRARGPHARRGGRRDQHEDHDPDRHGDGGPDAPDVGARAGTGPDAHRHPGRGPPAGDRRHERHRQGDRGAGPDQGATAEVAGSSTGPGRPRLRRRGGVGPRRAERMGGLDHVVCTAGVLRIGPLADTDPAVVRRGHRRQPHRQPQRRTRGLPVPARRAADPSRSSRRARSRGAARTTSRTPPARPRSST